MCCIWPVIDRVGRGVELSEDHWRPSQRGAGGAMVDQRVLIWNLTDPDEALRVDQYYVPAEVHGVGGLPAISGRFVLGPRVVSMRALRSGSGSLTRAYCAQSGVTVPCLR